MKVPFILFLTTILLFSCGSDEKDLDQYLVDISKFNMDENALKDGEKVRILGASGNLTNDDKMDFYNLIVVESLETGEEVNVLMINYIHTGEGPQTLDFISYDTPMGKLAAMDPAEVPKNIKVSEIELKKHQKVLYDTEYIQADVYDNPTIIGGLGIVSHYQTDPQNLEKEVDEIIENVTDSLSGL